MNRFTGEKGLFRSENLSKHGDMSTERAFKCVRECVRKGCLQQRLPAGKAHKLISVDTNGMPTFITVGHTGKNEAMHRVINHMCDFITVVTEETMEFRLAFGIYLYNRKRDEDYNLVRRDAPHPFQQALAPGARIQELDRNSDDYEPFGFAFKAALEEGSLQATLDAYNGIVEQQGPSALDLIPTAGTGLCSRMSRHFMFHSQSLMHRIALTKFVFVAFATPLLVTLLHARVLVLIIARHCAAAGPPRRCYSTMPLPPRVIVQVRLQRNANETEQAKQDKAVAAAAATWSMLAQVSQVAQAA